VGVVVVPRYTVTMAVRAEQAVLIAEPRSPAAAAPVPALLGVLAAAVTAVAVVRLSGAGAVPRLEEFALVFSSIVIEALPFVLGGALVSALIAVLVPERAFARIGRLPVAVQVPGAMACALAFPVCECGSVPVARRLIARGVHPAAGLAFMLAAPVVNPVVLASTWLAYSGSGLSAEMTFARAATGFAIAAVAGLGLQRFVGPRLVPSAQAGCDDHDHEGKAAAIGEHLATDALFMGRFLVLGAAVAALLQTAVPPDAMSRFAEIPVLGAGAMMLLAVLLSLCSESDAFVAVSFNAFSPGAQLAFLALGPVLDAKLAILYAASFRRSFVPALLVVAVPVILVVAALFDVFIG
jgi:uncharacterized membrane protein YraQ (UPF0718 family)